MRVLLVDDHPIMRSGLRSVLGTAFEVIEAASGEAAVPLASDVDVVLMDLQLGPGIDGAEATRRIRALPDPPAVLVLTTYDSEADILSAIAAGALGYLLKDAEPAELVAAVRAAAAGETVLAPAVATRLVGRVRRPAQTLTARETEILQQVAAGRTNQAIAKLLFISEATVKSHLVQVFAKLDVDNRTAATVEGRRRGLIR
ncbi:response regulator [Hamadaea tsunoensis]|uniref:response regulator n=1 Tax=Hamadaea tsunoensis TaxID=53368 RepID=UPI0003F4DB22|nr:response regulator transcription factor [Hamadaea tsunoensis]